MATLKDIAKQTDVTISSVSDILNDRSGSRYSEATRRKVRKAAQELGYDRNRLVQGMIRGRTQLIGLIVPDLSNPFYSDFIHYAAPLLQEEDYNLLIQEARPAPTPEIEAKALQTLVEFRVDGILAGLIHGSAHTKTLKKLSKRGIALSGVGLPSTNQDMLADSVGITYEKGLQSACQSIIESGRKRIAFLGNFPWDSKLGRRRELLNTHLAALGLPEQPVANIACEHNMGGARGAFRDFLQQTPKAEWPDALITLNDNLAIGACRAAADTGLSVPTDIAVIGFDNTRLGALQMPALSTIGVDLKELATTAARQLLDRLKKPQQSNRSKIFKAEFIPRETT